MKLTVPEALPFKQDNPKPQGAYTLGQTGNAQYARIFRPMFNQLEFYTGTDYDPSVQGKVDEYIDSKGLSGDDAEYLKRFGSSSQAGFDSAVAFIRNRSLDRQVLENSTGLNLFLTAPEVAASIALPLAGVRAAMYVGKGLQRLQGIAKVPGIGPNLTARATATFGDDLAGVARFAPERLTEIPYVGTARAAAAEEAFMRPVSMAVSAQTLMTGRRYTATELAKIGALDAAVVDGSISLTTALNEIGFDEDPADALINAALYTLGMTAMGGIAGYGLGAALGAPLRRGPRMQQFSTEYKRYLREASQRPADGADLSYAGAWFTESVFFRAIPTPIRTTILDKALPDKWKREMLKLGNDMGMIFRETQAGVATGPSVFVNSGRRLGEWYNTVKVIDSSFAKVNPTGASEFMNIPVGAAIQTVRRKLGKDVVTPGDWYNHVGRLYIDKTPYDRMTPEEAASVQALQSFFQRYEAELTGSGLINQRDVFFDTYLKEVARQGRAISLVNSIIAQNRRWMNRERAPLVASLEP